MGVRSIRPEGAYKIFWARIWIVDKHQPAFFTLNEALFPLSRKYVVDCGQRRFGSRFADSNDPAERKANMKTMRWEVLDKVPILDRLVCHAWSFGYPKVWPMPKL